jgi:hypothetical protein
MQPLLKAKAADEIFKDKLLNKGTDYVEIF